jgi:ribosomal-protein-alanine N-acetyltransferase
VPIDTTLHLRTERLLLRPPVVGDAPAAAEFLTDPDVMRFLGGATVALEHVSEVVEKWRQRWERNGMGPFMIQRRQDGRFLGRAGILIWDTRSWTQAAFSDAGTYAQPELGWALVRTAWGHGYATEAARAVRDWARRQPGINRLISLIASENVASQRVAQRLGASPAETVTLFDSSDAVVWVHPKT